MRVGFVGGGAMGEALVSAILKHGLADTNDIVVSDVAEARRAYLESTYGVRVTADNAGAAQDVDLLVLAVKPQEFSNVAAGLKGRIAAGQTAVSIMAGVSIERIAGALGHDAVVRVMPNTAAFVGQAMSVWIASTAVGEEGREAVASVLGALGREREVSDEKYLDMATAVSGSGPGFVFAFLEGLIDGALAVGFDRDEAEELAVQTLLGAACLAQESEKDASELRSMVTSKGGTTAAGLRVMEDAGVRGAIAAAVEAAYARAKEL